MKIVVPMAGRGSRFTSAGVSVPKPFIDINGKPMVRRVVDSLGLNDCEFVFICQAQHLQDYDMSSIFDDIKFQTVTISTNTEGAAITLSHALSAIGDDSFISVNSDQLFNNPSESIKQVAESDADGAVWCFTGESDKWSYIRIDPLTDTVREIAEKRRISNIATGGIYYWRSAQLYSDCLADMVRADDRVNGEFYVAPVHNYAINRGKIVRYRMLDSIIQLGTPEELREYMTTQ